MVLVELGMDTVVRTYNHNGFVFSKCLVLILGIVLTTLLTVMVTKKMHTSMCVCVCKGEEGQQECTYTATPPFFPSSTYGIC